MNGGRTKIPTKIRPTSFHVCSVDVSCLQNQKMTGKILCAYHARLGIRQSGIFGTMPKVWWIYYIFIVNIKLESMIYAFLVYIQ